MRSSKFMLLGHELKPQKRSRKIQYLICYNARCTKKQPIIDNLFQYLYLQNRTEQKLLTECNSRYAQNTNDTINIQN